MENLQPDNLIHIRFWDKSKYPPGEWIKEPDLISWFYKDLQCFIARDATVGILKGFVGVEKDHPLYNKTIQDLMDDKNPVITFPYGGLFFAGEIKFNTNDPIKMSDNIWFLGAELNANNDLLPLFQIQMADLKDKNIQPIGPYRNIIFAKKEVNKLAKYLFEMKKKNDKSNEEKPK